MKSFGLVDDIIPEPVGGAHWDYNQSAEILKNFLVPVIKELKAIPEQERINARRASITGEILMTSSAMHM